MPIGINQDSSAASTTGTATPLGWQRNAIAANELMEASIRSFKEGDEKKIHARLYFSYVKSKFKMLERIRMDRRVKALERAFQAAADAGQDMLGEKILREIAAFGRMSVMSAKGIRWAIAKDDLDRYKRRIRGGHISDTKLESYTREIPKNVVQRLNEVRNLFDSFVVYHYWNEKAQEDEAKRKEMTPDERSAMRDPVLFGCIQEKPGTLFFIADWEDETCDLTFDEMLEAMGKEYGDVRLPSEPDFS